MQIGQSDRSNWYQFGAEIAFSGELLVFAAHGRALRHIESGAHLTFVEAPETVEEVRRIPSSLSVPQIVNMIVGGRTPILEQTDFAEMGFGVVLYANVALQGAILGMQNALGALSRDGRMDDDGSMVASFAERQRLVQKRNYDQLEHRYALT